MPTRMKRTHEANATYVVNFKKATYEDGFHNFHMIVHLKSRLHPYLPALDVKYSTKGYVDAKWAGRKMKSTVWLAGANICPHTFLAELLDTAIGEAAAQLNMCDDDDLPIGEVELECGFTFIYNEWVECELTDGEWHEV